MAGAPDGIGFDVEVIRLVEHAVQVEVECICAGPGRKLEVGGGEDACGIHLTGRLEVVVVAELLTRTQPEVLQDDVGTDRRILAVETDGEVTALDAVGELFAHTLAELYGNIANIPLLKCLWG